MDYKIVCTDQVPLNQPTTHAHIVAVGIDTNNDGRAEEKRTKEEVINDIDTGRNRYYTIGSNSGKYAFVEVAACRFCGGRIIRSTPDAVTDNNLDSLRRCSWGSQ